jgi:hypothetical protein
MSLNINSFGLSTVQGKLDEQHNPSTFPAQIDSSSAGNLVPGQAVKIVDSAGGVPKVVECAANSDDVFGFINYDIKSQAFNAGDRVELSAFRGNVMYMTASAAIARNAKVSIVISGSKVVTASTGLTIVGRALDKASANGDLIRVMIDLPGTTA